MQKVIDAETSRHIANNDDNKNNSLQSIGMETYVWTKILKKVQLNKFGGLYAA